MEQLYPEDLHVGQRFNSGSYVMHAARIKEFAVEFDPQFPLLPDGASITPNASVVGSKGFSSNSVYSATKTAIRSFARGATDLKERRIRVNAVGPGTNDTPGLSELLASSQAGEQRKKMISASVPPGWFGTPTKSPRQLCFWCQKTAATSPGQNHLLTRLWGRRLTG